MISILWPTKKKPEPKLLGRLGRVLHWGLTAFGLLLLVMGLLNFSDAARMESATGLFLSDGSPSPETPKEAAEWHWRVGTKWFFQGMGVLVAGRAVRYVLSSE